jgi:hypothetical protein
VYWEIAELPLPVLREELKEMGKKFHGMGAAKKRDVLFFIRHNLSFEQMQKLLNSAEDKIRESVGYVKTPCSGRDEHNCSKVFECGCGLPKNWPRV